MLFSLSCCKPLYCFKIQVHPALAEDEVSDMIDYIDLMKNMLHLDAKQRLWPREAFAHPFITMSHLMDNTISSS